MRQRLLIVRDQNVPGNPEEGGNIPAWDVTLNYVPITSPTDPNSNNFVPAVLQMRPGDQEFWRVSNSAADTILDLQYVFDGQPQVMLVVAIDGVAVNSQDGTQPGDLIPVTHFVLPPASRVEFIVIGPSASVGLAQLTTQNINTGPIGDNDPARPLATIQLVNSTVADNDAYVPAFKAMNPYQQRFAGLGTQPVAVQRTVFFDEDNATSTFFMAVQGVPEHAFDPNAPPDIVATQGTVEQWIVQNRTQENHAFHFHQLHFLVQSQDNFELNGSLQAPAIAGQYLDMIQVPFWDGNPNHPYPSATLLIDFRGSDVGDFVFHCHILEHEDGGMMNIIRVQNPGGSQASLAAEPSEKAVAKPNTVVTESSSMSMAIGDHELEPQTQKRGPASAPDPHKPKEWQ